MNHQNRAKLFMHGQSQAVSLPDEFRMEGTEVEVSRHGDSITLTPIAARKKSWEQVFAEIDAMGPLDDYPDGWREQPMLPLPPRASRG